MRFWLAAVFSLLAFSALAHDEEARETAKQALDRAEQALENASTAGTLFIQLKNEVEDLRAEVDALKTEPIPDPKPEPKPDPDPDPDPDPKQVPFADQCAEPGVTYCNGFDADLSDAAYNNGKNRNFPIAIDQSEQAEGNGSLRLTIDASRTQEVTGTIGYDFPRIDSGTFYVGLKMRFGDGLQTLLRSQGFNHRGAGMKFFQIVPGSRSCDSSEIVLADNARQAWLTGIPTLVYSCSGHRITSDGDYQPIQGSSKEPCTRHTIDRLRDYDTGTGDGTVGFPPCRTFEDDTWHQVELEVRINDGYRLWIDGTLVIDIAGKRPPEGPYGRFYISNYITGYNDGRMEGSRTFGDGLWRIWYDNLIISRNCIASC